MSHDATKNLNDVMRKYDRESNTRAWEGKPKIAVQAYLAAFAIFEVYVTLFGTMLDEVRLTSFVGRLSHFPQPQARVPRELCPLVRLGHHGARRGIVLLFLL